MTTESSRCDPMAYVTLLSTDNYLDGVLALNESLRLCKSQYRLYVLVTNKVTSAVRDTLEKAGIRKLEIESISVPEEIRLVNLKSDHHRHWTGVFDKLLVFSLCEFRKIVYLDSDILVIKNIDQLFEKPHMSAVNADSYPGNESCLDLNAGVMVIEPEPNLTGRLIALLPEAFEQEKQWRAAAGRPPSMGVQSVINLFWREWSTTNELHLDRKYNFIVGYLHHFRRGLDYKWRGPDGVHALHFIGEAKPWMYTGVKFLRWVAWLVVRRRMWELAACHIAYMAVLKSARLHVRKGRRE
jgi:glycogenin